MCLSLGQSRRCAATCVMLGSEWRVRQPCVPPSYGCAPITLEPGPNSISVQAPLPRTGHRITPPAEATCKPLEANLAPVKFLFLSRLFLSLLGCKALVGGRIPLV